MPDQTISQMSNHTTDVLDLRSNGAKFDSYLSKSCSGVELSLNPNGAGPLSAQSALHSNGGYGLLHKTNEMKKLVSGLPENEPLTLISIDCAYASVQISMLHAFKTVWY